MAKTFNRPPITVNTPSSSDVKQYFFNHFNWKGLSDNKNFLAVDQETFSDCNNVYVNEEGLLRSRPSLKVKFAKYKNGSTEYILSNVVDMWQFEKVTVYKTFVDDVYYLIFSNVNFDDSIQASLQYTDDNGMLVSYEEVKLVVADNKIFVFAENSFNYYDIQNNSYNDATEFIYIPVTNVITDGVASSSREVESPNLLTGSYITKYLYTKSDNLHFENFVGKNVTVEIDGVRYSINFVYDNQVVFVSKYFKLSSYNFADDLIIGQNAEGYPFVETSDAGTIVSSYSYTVDEETKIPDIKWTIRYTTDGIVFETVDSNIEGVIGMPKISKDGNYCFVFKKDGPYVKSLLETDETLKYPDWKNLLQEVNEEQYAELNLNLNEISSDIISPVFNQSTSVNGYFVDDKIFAFVYGHHLPDVWQTDPSYLTLTCVYCNGTDIRTHDIFRTYKSEIIEIVPESTNTLYRESDSYYSYIKTVGSISRPGVHGTVTVTTDLLKSVCNFKNFVFNYVETDENEHNEYRMEIRDIVCTHQYEANKSSLVGRYTSIPKWGDATFSATAVLYFKDKEVFTHYIDKTIENYNPVGSSYNIYDEYFTITVNTFGAVENDANYGAIGLSITPKTIRSFVQIDGIQLPVGQYEYAYCFTEEFIPELRIFSNDTITNIAINFIARIADNDGYYKYYDASYVISDNSEGVDAKIVSYDIYESRSHCRSPINNAISVTDSTAMFAKIKAANDLQNTVVITNSFGSDVTTVVLLSETYDSYDFLRKRIAIGDNNIVTSNYYFKENDYVETPEFKIPLLFNANPISLSNNVMYLLKDDVIYRSSNDLIISVDELTTGKTNYLLPSHVAKLSNYYFSKDNTLYISGDTFELSLEKSSDTTSVVKSLSNEFKWYFPKIASQSFDYNITNLHTISNTDVAIFFDNSVSYVTYDNDLQAYRYTKSKLQAGCKKGSDVITSYDGKYTIFPSERGLVAMTYQQFMATEEQTLLYLSDNIFSTFRKYCLEDNSSNEIKLYKHAYWIILYKKDSEKLLVFDTRNNSWWPMSCFSNVSKIITQLEKPLLLINNELFSLNTSEAEYYDYKNEQLYIPWNIQSQKLHLNAINYYKHIVNMTFTSVHDDEVLQNSEYNVDSLDMKLQVNNYRKKIDGNINSDDYVSVNYDVNSAKTYIQRLNYSKVNEFQYLLSSNEQNFINIPLSLNSITIKYKIGGQVR